MPVANYSPELLEVFRRGARETLEIRLPSRSDAVRLRFRLNNLRKDMRAEQHRLLPLAESVQLSVRDTPDGRASLIAHVADNEFRDALRSAGIEVEPELPTNTPHSPNAQDTEVGEATDLEFARVTRDETADARARTALSEMFKSSHSDEDKGDKS